VSECAEDGSWRSDFMACLQRIRSPRMSSAPLRIADVAGPMLRKSLSRKRRSIMASMSRLGVPSRVSGALA